METDSSLESTDNRQVIDFFEREIEKLTMRFNKISDNPVCDLKIRCSSILAILQAGLLVREIRSATDEKRIKKTTRDFRHVRDVLNRFFDSVEKQLERKAYVGTTVNQKVAFGG